jgi:hypothetical protein
VTEKLVQTADFEMENRLTKAEKFAGRQIVMNCDIGGKVARGAADEEVET